MDFYRLEKGGVLSALKSGNAGLSDSEALSRINEYGKNELTKKKGTKIFKIIWNQINNYVVYILVAALIISFLLKEFLDFYVILAILLLNTMLGFAQEYKADKAIEKLKSLATPVCRVIRDGKQEEISSLLLVPGDVILVDAGAKVPADCYLLEAFNLKVDESLLTGESFPVSKKLGVINKDVHR